MNAPSGRGDRRRSDGGEDEEDPLARDFRPPPSHVRKRPPPRPATSLREFEEGLAYQAASDQLSSRRRAFLQRGTERKVHQSSHSSASSLGNLHDTADLYRRPVGSFAEDSPPRDRRSPFDSNFFGYLSAAETQHEQAPELSKWPPQFENPPNDYSPGCHRNIKEESLSPSHPPPSADGIARHWDAIFPREDDHYTGSTEAQASPTKTIPSQDVFRSPTVHELKKAISRSSPGLSLSALDTPGALSHNFSPMPGFDEYVEDKRIHLGSSIDEEERFSFEAYEAPPSPLNELEGVQGSPLQSSSKRKSVESKASPTSPFVQQRERPHSVPPQPKSSSLPVDGSNSSQQRWADRNPSNVRRVTMGEPQSARSLADINTMMRGQVDSTAAVIPPETPVLEPISTKGRRSKSPQIEPVPLNALEPLPSTNQKTSKDASSICLPKPPASRPAKPSSLSLQKTKAPSSAPRPPPSHLPPYRYASQPPRSQPPRLHRYPGTYPPHPPPFQPPPGALFPPEYVTPQGRSPHIPPNYHPRSTNATIMPATYPPPPSLNIPPRFSDERVSSPMLPGGFAVPSTPRFRAAAYGSRPPQGTANLPPMLYHYPPHPLGTGPYPWPNSDRKGPPPQRFSPSHPFQGMASDSLATSVPAASAGKENAPATPIKAKRVPCNCKKSRCLKLYCECFSAQVFCDSCNCIECLNTEQDVVCRDKAIKETLHKNRTAFEVRASGPLATGCKCKRSECLKKYCECFEAGIICGDHCKCSSCSNRAGSQKLIDKRRKMKDTKGAEYAMKISKEAWLQSIPVVPASTMHKPPVKQPLARGIAPPERYPRATRMGPNASLEFSPLEIINDGYQPRMVDVDRFVHVRTPLGEPPMKTEPESPMETSVTTILSHGTAPVAAVTGCTVPREIGARNVEGSFTPAGVRRLSFDSTAMSMRKKQKQECNFPKNKGMEYIGDG